MRNDQESGAESLLVFRGEWIDEAREGNVDALFPPSAIPMKIRLFGLIFLTSASAVQSADIFGEMIRSTPWLSPADEQKLLVVPEGFAVQLVASEPEIGKPISMSFDVRGRLWVAETNAYPIETAADKTPRDLIRILADFQPDGRPGKNLVFADGLSMPDAVAPYKNGAVIFSIPNITRLEDRDGDGRADERKVVLGPFATNDTHNMANNFRRGFDGWMYGGQGVANKSVMKGSDGREFRMSGGTFRFRPEGTSIQKYGDGQANVFGLCFDPLGNLFTSDCHSMPIYQNIYGGFYPVFGKPHDGLGYAPQMLTHNHGSTAISGLITCEEPMWPADFQGNFLLGNVVTSRVNRDRIEEHGSTKLAKEMPDFLRSGDPWFRPVDVQFGPDGALYIADFYNRIIAHVEIPLSHPGRDRKSGRIWRIVRVDKEGKPLLRVRPDFEKMSVAEKVEQLGDPSLAFRLAVVNYLADQGGEAVIGAVRVAMKKEKAPRDLRAGGLWILERLGVLTDAELVGAAGDSDRLLRTHALRIVVERGDWKATDLAMVLRGLEDEDGFVARVAADGLARHPALAQILPLLALRERASAEDTHLVYQVRKALRDQLLLPGGFEFLRGQKLTEANVRAVADVALALPGAGAARFFADLLAKSAGKGKPNEDWVRQIARFGDGEGIDQLASALTANSAGDLDGEVGLFQAMRQGLEQRGMKLSEKMQAWGGQLATRLLDPTPPVKIARQKAGADLALKLQLSNLEKPLLAMVRGNAGDPEVRSMGLRALLSMKATDYLGEAGRFLNEADLAPERRGEVAQALAKLNTVESRKVLIEALRQAPERMAKVIASALCSTGDGGDALIDAIAAGQAPARLLAERSIKDKLMGLRPARGAQIGELLGKVGMNSERLQKIAKERSGSFLASAAKGANGVKVEEGAKIFQAQCAVCHSLAGKGGRVGPELDGIGHRGVERLCEDVIDPNRNVDRVFRYSVITLKNGTVLTGLFRREEGAVMIFVDPTGKEVVVEKATIVERKETETSLMPEIFGEVIEPGDFQSLLAFLLSQSTPTR